jgi:hypothetical protein
MWTEQDISEVILMGALILSSPLIYKFTRKLIVYLFNRFIPRDAVIDCLENGKVVSSYYVKRGLFRRPEYYKLDIEIASSEEHHAR